MPDRKQLAELHPLFNRLSGQVIWTLLEDNDATPEEADLFMTRYFAWRDAVLDTMQRMYANPRGFVVLRTQDCGRACPKCARLDGHYFSAAMPDLADHLPPFSIGCRCLPEYVDTLPEGATVSTPDIVSGAPRHRLCCSTRPMSRMLLDMRNAQAR